MKVISVLKMQLKAKESVFWPKITADNLQIAESCKVCQTFFRSQQREILIPHKVVQGPWEKIGVDFFQFESTKYLLITACYSWFPIIRRMRSTMTTSDVVKQVFGEYVVPKMVMSDRGPQFSSKIFKAFANQYCSDHITSSPRYPQSNGMIVQMVQTVK